MGDSSRAPKTTPVQELKDAIRATDVLANERTYLAYVRTALAFIGFGFVIARFSLFEREFAVMAHEQVATTNISTPFGTGMAVFGVVIGLLGAWRYAAADRGFRQGRVVAFSPVAGYAIATGIAAIGIIVAFALLGLLGK
jgi:putative membrane protein